MPAYFGICTEIYRIRRVKCDEARPQCLRCLKFGLECDGFPIIAPGYQRAKSKCALKIRPWNGPGSGPKSRPLAQRFHLSPSQLLQPPPDISFQNATEQTYFQAFRYDVIPEISGVFNASFWNHIVLPTCHDRDAPFVRDMILAIAAIRLSTGESQHSNGPSKHHQFALERYDQAVRAMRSMLSNEARHLRQALISCLLVFCFEGFLGYPKQALLHARSGYHLLQNWMVKSSRPLMRLRCTPTASSLIEDELFDTFNILHLHAVTIIGDTYTPESHEFEQAYSDEILANMSLAFSDLGEAHRYFTAIVKRIAAFVQKAAQVTTSYIPSVMHYRHSREQNKFSGSSLVFGSSIHTPFSSGPVPNNILLEYYRNTQEITQWQESFKPVRLNPDQSHQPGVIILQANAITMRFILDSVVARDECSWDKFLPECRSIIALAKTFFRTTSKTSPRACRFSMEVGLLPVLYMVCKVCRDGLVRREAIAMMRLCSGRECVWDSGLAAQTSMWLMEIEEEGMIDGYIPENARARITKVEVDILTKSATLECTKRTNYIDGGVAVRKTTIRWD